MTNGDATKTGQFIIKTKAQAPTLVRWFILAATTIATAAIAWSQTRDQVERNRQAISLTTGEVKENRERIITIERDEAVRDVDMQYIKDMLSDIREHQKRHYED